MTTSQIIISLVIFIFISFVLSNYNLYFRDNKLTGKTEFWIHYYNIRERKWMHRMITQWSIHRDNDIID